MFRNMLAGTAVALMILGMHCHSLDQSVSHFESGAEASHRHAGDASDPCNVGRWKIIAGCERLSEIPISSKPSFSQAFLHVSDRHPFAGRAKSQWGRSVLFDVEL